MVFPTSHPSNSLIEQERRASNRKLLNLGSIPDAVAHRCILRAMESSRRGGSAYKRL